jgi:hypothetical protein
MQMDGMWTRQSPWKTATDRLVRGVLMTLFAVLNLTALVARLAVHSV